MKSTKCLKSIKMDYIIDEFKLYSNDIIILRCDDENLRCDDDENLKDFIKIYDLKNECLLRTIKCEFYTEFKLDKNDNLVISDTVGNFKIWNLKIILNEIMDTD